MSALACHFGSCPPQLVVEPGRAIVAAAGTIRREVVAVRTGTDGRRWVYLDIGGLAETEKEYIRYRLRRDANTDRRGRADQLTGPGTPLGFGRDACSISRYLPTNFSRTRNSATVTGRGASSPGPDNACCHRKPGFLTRRARLAVRRSGRCRWVLVRPH
jgi:hypothetical protein